MISPMTGIFEITGTRSMPQFRHHAGLALGAHIIFQQDNGNAGGKDVDAHACQYMLGI